jgi:hypothetical protein
MAPLFLDVGSKWTKVVNFTTLPPEVWTINSTHSEGAGRISEPFWTSGIAEKFVVHAGIRTSDRPDRSVVTVQNVIYRVPRLNLLNPRGKFTYHKV